MPFDAESRQSDTSLLRRYAAGDARAARALTQRLSPMVFRVAVRLLGDRAEAEDIAQEAMLRLWRIAPDWREGDASVSTWLYRVTVNLCTDRLRSPRSRSAGWPDDFDPPDDTPGPEMRLQEAARATALESALGVLPERQRTAVVLRNLEGLSNPEIADIMDVSVEAVESLVARGKRALAKLLAKQREELGFSDD